LQAAYFCGGGVGGGAGFAGCDLVCEALTPCSTEFAVVRREANTESVIDVTMKMMADQVVARERTVAAPRGPKAVWLPMPPNAAATSPLFPLCSSTTTMRKKQTEMWTMVINMVMRLSYGVDKTEGVRFPFGSNGQMGRNPASIAGLLYDAQAAEHKPSIQMA
jgi:hypothetical protein